MDCSFALSGRALAQSYSFGVTVLNTMVRICRKDGFAKDCTSTNQ